MYLPVPAGSVPFSLRIRNWVGERIARHSSSDLATGVTVEDMVLVNDIDPISRL